VETTKDENSIPSNCPFFDYSDRLLVQSKHKQELKYLLTRYGHQDIAQALVELSKAQEEADHPDQQRKAAATQRVQIWQEAYESLQA
jgi:hypothetical protein